MKFEVHVHWPESPWRPEFREVIRASNGKGFTMADAEKVCKEARRLGADLAAPMRAKKGAT